MIKDAIENYNKSVHDRSENEQLTKCYNRDTKKLEDKKWEDMKCGEIVRVEEDQFFPADLILLNSPGPKGTLYVETKNLDGETNLKMKQV